MANTFHLSFDLTNCYTECPEGDYPLNSTIHIEIKANEGYEFQIAPSYAYMTDIGRYIKVNFNIDNSTTCSHNVKMTESHNICIKGTTVKQSVITDKYGLITAYRPSKDELVNISKKRFVAITAGDSSPNISYIDTADYLVSLMKLYVYLESDSREIVYFGGYNMQVECDVIGTDIITLNCGNINISGKYQNSIDYENTDIRIYLPFIGFKDLNTDDFMNKSCNLTYQVNVINGESLAIISANNNIIETYSCNVGFKIPYKLMNEMYISSKIEPNSNYLADMTPFLYVKNHIANIPVNMPYGNVNEYVQLGTLSGFTITKVIYFEVIHDTITMPEIEEIKALFLDGVVL